MARCRAAQHVVSCRGRRVRGVAWRDVAQRRGVAPRRVAWLGGSVAVAWRGVD